MEDIRFMKEALALAREASEAGEVPVGCVIVRKGEIVGRGRNRREGDKSALAHAEIEAIREACANLGGWRLWECTLYVTLEPCPMCAGAIINARIPGWFTVPPMPNAVPREVYAACSPWNSITIRRWSRVFWRRNAPRC